MISFFKNGCLRINPTCHLKNFLKWPIFKVCLCILQACEVLLGVILSLGSVEKRRSAGTQKTWCILGKCNCAHYSYVGEQRKNIKVCNAIKIIHLNELFPLCTGGKLISHVFCIKV